MAFLTTVFTFIVANWAMLLGIISSLLGFGALVAKLTPNPKDDRVFAALLRWFKLVPVSVGNTAPAIEAPGTDGEEPPIMG